MLWAYITKGFGDIFGKEIEKERYKFDRYDDDLVVMTKTMDIAVYFFTASSRLFKRCKFTAPSRMRVRFPIV